MATYDADFWDGETGRRHRVTARLGEETLTVTDASGQELRRWPVERLRISEEVYSGQPVRIGVRKDEARLAVADAAILEELGRQRWRLRAYDLRGANPIVRLAFWFGALAVTALTFYFGLPLAAEPVAAVMPLSWEERLGRTVRDQVYSMVGVTETSVCRNPEGKAALERLVRRLEKTVDTRYTFRPVVVDHRLVNAFAAPGGYIVIFRGLIDKAESAEEVAGVVAHEMGHVVERHATESLIRGIGASLILSAITGDTSTVQSSVTDFGNNLLTLSNSRNLEREADAVGVRMLNAAGIQATGLATFFQRLSKNEGDGAGLAQYMSTHPPSGERAEFIGERSKASGRAMTEREWRAFQNICSGSAPNQPR